MRRYVLMSGLLATTLAACNSDRIVGPGDMVAFARAKSLWDSKPFDDYFYEIRTFCFCPPEVTRWNRVVVHEGEVISVDPVERTSSYVPPTTYFHSIDSLFSQLHRAMTDGGFSSAYAAIEVDYHRELGYPERIVYHEAPYVADAGATIEIRSVSSLAIVSESAVRR